MKPLGKILWTDLTVIEAESIKDFYCKVIGWTAEPVPVDDHQDYLINASDDTIAGICHQKGALKNYPNQWINYFGVKNLDQSIAICIAEGGTIIDGPVHMGGSNIAIMKDPQGAFFAVTSIE